jgi:cytochrome P450
MKWAMSLLLEHLEAMKRALAEMDTNAGQVRFSDETDLPKLSYLQNINDESLRLYPPVPLVLPHESSGDCTVGRFDVPRGTVLLINAWTFQWDPYH